MMQPFFFCSCDIKYLLSYSPKHVGRLCAGYESRFFFYHLVGICIGMFVIIFIKIARYSRAYEQLHCIRVGTYVIDIFYTHQCANE